MVAKASHGLTLLPAAGATNELTPLNATKPPIARASVVIFMMVVPADKGRAGVGLLTRSVAT